MNKGWKAAEKAATNTFETTVKGFSINPQTFKGQDINARVMFTSDNEGETLSIYDPSTKNK